MAHSPKRCAGSGRVIADKWVRQAIFTGTWVVFCPWHKGATGLIAERNTEGRLRRRYVEHSHG